MRPIVLSIALFLMVAPAMAQVQVGRLVGEDRGPGEWTEFASPEDRITCNFPGRPAVTETAWTSEFGAELKGRIYSAQRGSGRYHLTAIDYSPVEAILTAKAKACPTGAETCRGGADTGVGYWKNDIRGAIDYRSVEADAAARREESRTSCGTFRTWSPASSCI